MIVNRDTPASSFHPIEQVYRFFVFEHLNLANLMFPNPVVGRRDPIPTQRDNQDLRLRIQQPFYMLQSQLMGFGDLASAPIRPNLKI